MAAQVVMLSWGEREGAMVVSGSCQSWWFGRRWERRKERPGWRSREVGGNSHEAQLFKSKTRHTDGEAVGI